jgi:hypothetical protein
MLLQIPNFSENLQCLTTFFADLLLRIGQSEVVPCSDRAAAHIVGAASIQAPASDHKEKRDPFGHRKWPYWRTTATELGPAGMKLPFSDLQFPRQAAPQEQPACTLTATYVAHFFPS